MFCILKKKGFQFLKKLILKLIHYLNILWADQHVSVSVLPGTWGRSLSSRPISVERLSCCIVDLVKLLLQVWVFPTSHHTAAAGRGPTGTSWSPANFSVLWSSSSETSRAKRPTPPDPVSVVSHTPSQVTEVRGKMFLFLYISRCCCRNRGTGAEFKRFSGQGSVPGLRQGSLLHQSHSQLHLGAGADSAALLPQGLSVLW